MYLSLNAEGPLTSPFLILPSHFVFFKVSSRDPELAAKSAGQTYIDITVTVMTFPGNENEEGLFDHVLFFL